MTDKQSIQLTEPGRVSSDCPSCGGEVQGRWYTHDDEFFIPLDAPEPPGVWRCYCPPCDLEFWSDDVSAPARTLTLEEEVSNSL